MAKITVYVSINNGLVEEFTIDGTISGLKRNKEFIDNYVRIQLEHPYETLSYSAFINTD